ncbi:MAG: hypothetical protein WA400_05950 [Silvibacterium sp.]
MDVSSLDNIFWVAGVVGHVLLLAILFRRRLYRMFPVFSIFVLWAVISDPLLYLVLSAGHGGFNHYYFQTYYAFSILEYLLELGVLLEIAANVIRPAKQSFQRGVLYFFLGAILVIGLGSFFFAARANAVTLTDHRTFIVIDTGFAILRLVIFLLIAGFSQVLGLNWKNHVLQLATGLAFYSLVMLVGELAQSQLRAGPIYTAQYSYWSKIQVIGYLCTLYFWCYAFAKKEAPRKEFSPQMTKILVSLSGSTKRQGSVLARTRDQ